jgi:hypothetical protein
MSTYHPEVLPARKVIPDPGDVTFEFNRNYLCINPNAALGPPTWRVSEPDEMPCGDGTIIPPPPDTAEYLIIAANPLVLTGDNSATEISLDISLAPEIDTPSADRVFDSIEGFDSPPLLTSVSGNPVLALYDVNDRAAILSLAFGGLADVPDTIRKNLSVTVQDYNSRGSTQSFTSIDPIELNERDGLTQVTLDINSLPPAP